MKTCVIIPAYNEESKIALLVNAVRGAGFDVVVIDDGSQDRTSSVAGAAGAHVIRSEINKGKGSSLLKGFRYALKNGYDLIITMDGDGQHLPGDIQHLLDCAYVSRASLVIGNRMNTPHTMPLLRKVTNRCMSRLISLLTRQNIPDTQCGFRLIKRVVLENVHLATSNYETESEILIKAARQGFIIASVPITTVYGDEKSNIHPIRDSYRFIALIFDQMRWQKEMKHEQF